MLLMVDGVHGASKIHHKNMVDDVAVYGGYIKSVTPIHTQNKHTKKTA